MAQSPLQGRVVGVDIVPEAVDSARRRAREAGVQASCAFVQADVFSLSPSASSDQRGQQGEGEEAWGVEAAWEMAHKQEQAIRHGSSGVANAAAGQTEGATPATSRAGRPEGSTKFDFVYDCQVVPSLRGRPADSRAKFDFVYDCQAFHALRSVDEAGYIRLLRASLRPGGLLLLLTGNANEPEVGPSALTKEELLAAFSPPNWQWLFLLQTRFDSTPAYERLGQLPLAWWGMLRRL